MDTSTTTNLAIRIRDQLSTNAAGNLTALLVRLGFARKLRKMEVRLGTERLFLNASRCSRIATALQLDLALLSLDEIDLIATELAKTVQALLEEVVSRSNGGEPEEFVTMLLEKNPLTLSL